MRADTDPALDTLLLPLAERLLDWPADGVLFLRARQGAALHDAPRPGLVCEQSFKPAADALARAGWAVREADDGTRYPLVLVLPPRQRDEARALFARAVAATAPGGRGQAPPSRPALWPRRGDGSRWHRAKGRRCRSLHPGTTPRPRSIPILVPLVLGARQWGQRRAAPRHRGCGLQAWPRLDGSHAQQQGAALVPGGCARGTWPRPHKGLDPTWASTL